MSVRSKLPLTVCIVTHRRPALLAAGITRIDKCDLPENYSGLLVVENGGCHESRTVVKGLPARLRARHIECSSRSKCSALNAALLEIESGLIVFTDDDTEPSEGWLAAYAAAYAEYGSGFYFGGPNEPRYDVAPPDWLKRFLPSSAAGFMLKQRKPEITPRFFLGFNWAAEAEALRACGGFSRQFGPGTALGTGDETFMQFQLAQRGVTPVFVADAQIRHYVPVERCTPDWSLRRGADGEFAVGIQHEWYHRTRSLPCRPWRSALRRVVKTSTLSDIAQLALLRPAGRYWARRSWATFRSFVNGISYARQHRPLDPRQWAADGLGDSIPATAQQSYDDVSGERLTRDDRIIPAAERS